MATILEAAVQVLAKEGAQLHHGAGGRRRPASASARSTSTFRTRRAILFRLQSDEWRQTGDLLRGILEETAKPLLERLRALVHAFVRSECEEAQVRGALDDAAPLYRDAPEAQERPGCRGRGPFDLHGRVDAGRPGPPA
ncbi:hypothetical protein ACRAWD_20130 [Caulobacter segnis]